MPSNTWQDQSPNQYLGNPVDLTNDRGWNQNQRDIYAGRADDTYNWGVGASDKNEKVADEVTGRALDTSKSFADYAKADRGMWEGKGVAGLNKQMDDALGWASDPELAKARAEASAGANITFDAAGDMAKRALAGYGVDPSAGRYAGLDQGLAMKRATASSGQQNAAMNRRRMDQQSLLDRANARWAVLPGQSANEAGVSMAAGNAAANTRMAAGAAGKQLREPSGWAPLTDKRHDAIRESLIEQTKLGMIQNQQAAENALAREKLAQSQSSGIGAGLGLLGSVAKIAAPMVGGWLGGGAAGIDSAGNSIGGSGASAPGGSLSLGLDNPYTLAGIGNTPPTIMSRRGGRIPGYRAGGSVRRPDTAFDADAPFDPSVHRGYRPRVQDEPAREDRGPVYGFEPDAERPQSDSYSKPEPRRFPGSRREQLPYMDRMPLPSPDETPDEAEQESMPSYLYGGDVSDDLQDTSNIAGSLSSVDPTGYLGFGSDALDIASDLSAPNDDIEKRPGDMLGLTGEYDLDKTEQAGGSVGSMGGRIIGSIFGMPGVGAKVGRGLGEGVGAMVQGRFGEGFENMGRAALSAAEAPLAMMGGLGGGGGMGGLPGMGGLMGGGGGQQQAPAAPDHTFDMDAGDAMERSTMMVAEGGEIPDDEYDEMMPDDEMMEGELTPEVGDQGMYSERVVPPEASPSGGAETDDVHAMVNEGEFIIPKPVTNWLGEKFFQKLIEKAYAEMQGPKVAEPEMGPPTAMAISPPSFQSMGA